jgi:hypothetical protein
MQMTYDAGCSGAFQFRLPRRKKPGLALSGFAHRFASAQAGF